MTSTCVLIDLLRQRSGDAHGRRRGAWVTSLVDDPERLVADVFSAGEAPEVAKTKGAAYAPL